MNDTTCQECGDLILEDEKYLPVDTGDTWAMKKLRVWHIPQVSCATFYVDVDSVEEAVKIMNTLSMYDIFQFDNNIKGDFCNACGLEAWCDGEWSGWFDPETGDDDPEVYLESKNCDFFERRKIVT